MDHCYSEKLLRVSGGCAILVWMPVRPLRSPVGGHVRKWLPEHAMPLALIVLSVLRENTRMTVSVSLLPLALILSIFEWGMM